MPRLLTATLSCSSKMTNVFSLWPVSTRGSGAKCHKRWQIPIGDLSLETKPLLKLFLLLPTRSLFCFQSDIFWNNLSRSQRYSPQSSATSMRVPLVLASPLPDSCLFISRTQAVSLLTTHVGSNFKIRPHSSNFSSPHCYSTCLCPPHLRCGLSPYIRVFQRDNQ